MVGFGGGRWGWLVGVSVALCACQFDESGQAGVAIGRGANAGGSGGAPVDTGAAPPIPIDAMAPGDAVFVADAGVVPLVDAELPPPPTPDAAAPAPDAEPPLMVDAAPPAPDTEPPALPSPPVAHWRLDEDSGITVADSSGSNNTGTLRGDPGFADGFPQATFPNPGALSFDGVNDQVVAGTARIPPPQAPKTISLWVRPPIVPVGSRAFVSLTNRGVSCGLHLGTKGAQLAVWNWGGEVVVARIAPPGALWHHVLYSYDGTRHSLRVDGGPPEVGTTPPQSCALASVVLGNYEAGGNWFQGTLDDVRIYDRVISETEARALAEGREVP